VQVKWLKAFFPMQGVQYIAQKSEVLKIQWREIIMERFLEKFSISILKKRKTPKKFDLQGFSPHFLITIFNQNSANFEISFQMLSLFSTL
jgi:hypothetical protein